MSSFIFFGRQYEIDEFLKDTASLAALLARNARIVQPLPPDIDLTQAEQTEIQTQLRAIIVLPSFAINDFWNTFAANHLVALASAIRSLAFQTQHQALSTLIQILSLLPDPSNNPYFRRFLCYSSDSNGLATLVSDAFVRGIAWKPPSGPGQICTLIMNLLVWSDTTQGNDGKSCINAEGRRAIVRRLVVLARSPRYDQIGEEERDQMYELSAMLNSIEIMPGDLRVKTARQLLEQPLDQCSKPSCPKDAGFICSRCKTVRYCGVECQKRHWTNGHKLRCFRTNF